MSTSGTPGPSSQPATGWYPNLDGQGLPRALTSGVQQSYTLIYSLRDTVNQLKTTVSTMIQYGTAHERSQVSAQTVPDGALFFETDTGGVYQARLKANSTTRDWFLAINGVAAAGP